MDAVVIRDRTAPDRAAILMAGGFTLLAVSAFSGSPAVALLVGAAACLATWHREILRWPHVVGAVLAVALLVPFGRYELPAALPFGVDLYRVTVLAVIVFWFASLLVDEEVRLRRSPFDLQLAVIVGATLASVAVNLRHAAVPTSAIWKAVVLFLSFILVYYFIVSIVRTPSAIVQLTKTLVTGVAVIAVVAIIEQRSGFNIFDHLEQILPLHFDGPVENERDGLTRAVASAEHPIALGVLFAMTAPVGAALAFGSGRIWWIPTSVVTIGVVATVSRTPLLVAIAALIALLWLRPREIKRLLPLVVPLIVVVKLMLPGSIATLKNSFFPDEGLVVQQSALSADADPLLAGGRVRQLSPGLREAGHALLLGQGLGSRQTGFDNPLRNAPILDNQWLSNLLTVGIIGTAGWVALMLGAVIGLGRASRLRAGPDGWLAAGFAASITGFALGMFTYDSLAFSQVTFVFWFLLALSASLLLVDQDG